MAKRRARQNHDRAAEYIDSSLMSQRLKYGRHISARIEGNYGVYRTRVQLASRRGAHCTCPSESWPCKHARALEATWKANPKSFFDLAAFLTELVARPKPALIKAIAEMVITAPESLGGIGVHEFAQSDDALDE